MSLTAQQFAAQMPDASELLSDEPEMESSLHYQQLAMLVSSLEWLWQTRDDFFIGANLSVYYADQQLQRRTFRGPDFFLVRDVEQRPRKSWVVWAENGRYPDLIIELLSSSTAKVDRTDKKVLYQNVFRTPEYFWFSPDSAEFEGFRLVDGHYEEIGLNKQGWRWSNMLDLYLGVDENELRYFDAQGDKIPTPSEAAKHERDEAMQAKQEAIQARQQAAQAQKEALEAQQYAEQAQQQAARANQKAAALTKRLRELGIDTDAIE